MMRQMRENTKWIMLLTALAFVGLMVFQWGMDLSGRTNAQAAGGQLGSVNGEPITADEYQTAYRNLYRQQQEQLGDRPITASMNREIEEGAWEQLVGARLIDQELRRRGIKVSSAEILQAAQFAPPPDLMTNELFLTDGQFDLQKYQAFLQQPLDDQTLLQLEAYYRDVIPRSKLYFQNTAGAFVSDGQLWRMWRDVNETAQVRFLTWDPAALVPDSAVRVSDAAIRSYYEEHRDDFIRPARATVKFLVLPRAANAQDSAAALALAQQARTRLAAGETFEQVAGSLSTDTISPLQRTSLRMIRGGGVFPPAFEQTAFNAPLGQLTEPVLTPYGYHVVRVDERAGDTATVRQVLVRVELGEAREDSLLERADSLEALAEDLKLEEIGRRTGLRVATIELTPPLALIPGVAGSDDGVDWALREGEPGEVSELFEASNAFYMLELVNRAEEGTLTLQEATPAIRPILARRQQVEQARTRLQPAVAAARAGQSLAQIATQYGATVQEAGPFARADNVPGLGRLNAAIGTAFGLQPGQTSDLVEADGQLFLVQGVALAGADRAEWEKQLPAQRQRVRTALADERWQQFIRGLREQAEIVDNREAVRRQQQQLAGQSQN
jgi:peptidyl-prolyl cis-trans isomerase D